MRAQVIGQDAGAPSDGGGRRWLRACEILVILALLLAGADVLRGLDAPAAAADAVAGSAARGPAAQDPLERLAAAGLFGAPRGGTPVEPPAAAPPGVPALLAGVMVAEIGTDARAILVAADGTQQAYGLGDALPDGSRVLRIEPAHVVLERDGRSYTLELAGRREATAAAPEPAPEAPAPAPRALGRFTVDKRGHESSRRFLAELRAKVMQDPRELGRLLAVDPVPGGDGLAGFRINADGREALLARAGLESGDLVTEVNGIRLDGRLKGLALADALASARDVEVALVRNGTPVTVRLRIGD